MGEYKSEMLKTLDDCRGNPEELYAVILDDYSIREAILNAVYCDILAGECLNMQDGSVVVADGHTVQIESIEHTKHSCCATEIFFILKLGCQKKYRAIFYIESYGGEHEPAETDCSVTLLEKV
jgi:hypothetical protein